MGGKWKGRVKVYIVYYAKVSSKSPELLIFQLNLSSLLKNCRGWYEAKLTPEASMSLSDTSTKRKVPAPLLMRGRAPKYGN
jgi:hypothetical protein